MLTQNTQGDKYITRLFHSQHFNMSVLDYTVYTVLNGGYEPEDIMHVINVIKYEALLQNQPHDVFKRASYIILVSI